MLILLGGETHKNTLNTLNPWIQVRIRKYQIQMDSKWDQVYSSFWVHVIVVILSSVYANIYTKEDPNKADQKTTTKYMDSKRGIHLSSLNPMNLYPCVFPLGFLLIKKNWKITWHWVEIFKRNFIEQHFIHSNSSWHMNESVWEKCMR